MKNKKLRLGLLFMVLVFGVSLIGCNNLGNANVITRMNIANATNLFIAPGNSPNRLFKVTEDGFVERVTFTFCDGSTSTEYFSPSSLQVLDDTFILISFSSNNYLVNVNTGAAYIFPLQPPDPCGNQRVERDDAGNIYFISGNSLVRLSVANPNNVTLTTMSAQGDVLPGGMPIFTFNFSADRDGNVVYSARTPGGQVVSRLRLNSTGGFHTLPYGGGHYSTFWTDFDGRLHAAIDPNRPRMIVLTPYPFGYTDFGPPFAGRFRNILRMNDRERIVGIEDNAVFQLYGPGSPRLIPFDTFNLDNSWNRPITISTASDRYYYIVGFRGANQVLLRVNPLTDEYTTLVAENFEFYAITVGNDDVVIFNAIQFPQGRRVIGQVSSPDNVQILDYTINAQVIVLERIR